MEEVSAEVACESEKPIVNERWMGKARNTRENKEVLLINMCYYNQLDSHLDEFELAYPENDGLSRMMAPH